MACRGSAIYLELNQGLCKHPGISGDRLNSNLLGSAWLLGVKPGTGFDIRQLQFCFVLFSTDVTVLSRWAPRGSWVNRHYAITRDLVVIGDISGSPN